MCDYPAQRRRCQKADGGTPASGESPGTASTLCMQVGRLTGFIPYKLMDPDRLAAYEPRGGVYSRQAASEAQQEGEAEDAGASSTAAKAAEAGEALDPKVAAAAQRQRAFQPLVGQSIKVKVTQVGGRMQGGGRGWGGQGRGWPTSSLLGGRAGQAPGEEERQAQRGDAPPTG